MFGEKRGHIALEMNIIALEMNNYKTQIAISRQRAISSRNLVSKETPITT